MGKCMKNYSRWLTAAIILVIAFGPVNSIAQSGFKDIGGFESEMPSYWTIGSQPDGSTLTWATDDFLSLGRSLKITKGVTSEAAVWKSENMCDQWTPTHSADIDWKLGAFVKTMNVNTNPANDDERWYLKWEFWDNSDVFIGETMVPIDQSVASNGDWVADTNDVSETILPRESFTTIVSFVGGKDATGTVWVDEFIMSEKRGREAGAMWNSTFICPTGWFYWLPRTDDVVSRGYENTRLTSEEAHSGETSLMFYLPFDREVHDAFIGVKRIPLDNTVEPGDTVRVSVWIKATDLVPDSAAAYPLTWSCGFTPMFFKSADNNAGFDEIRTGTIDSHFEFPAVTEFDWTEYTMDYTIPEETGAMSVRLHPYTRFTGTIYFDDFTVKEIGETTDIEDNDKNTPLTFELGNNYPNPFNPTTTLEYSIPDAGRITLEIFNVLGQNVLTLVDEDQPRGRYQVMWDGKDKAGSLVGSGIYFYQLRTSKAVTVKKMVLLK